MKILNTEDYVNEKLNIQPIDKDKLKERHSQIPLDINGVVWSATNFKGITYGGGNHIAPRELVKDKDYFEFGGETFYTFDAAMKLNLPNGWRIPIEDDFHKSFKTSNLQKSDFKPFLSKECGGLDEYGFGAGLIGYVYKGTHIKDGAASGFWCAAQSYERWLEKYNNVCYMFDTDDIYRGLCDVGNIVAFPIRLVKGKRVYPYSE